MASDDAGRWLARTLIVLLLGYPIPAAGQPLSPEPREWRVKGELPGDKDISGIACLPPGEGRRRCLIAVDEGYAAVFVSLSSKSIRVIREIRLAPDVPKEELDAEGAAYDAATKAFYIVGSHGRRRHKCDNENSSSLALVRVPVSPITGRPDYDYASGIADPNWIAPQIRTSPHILAAMKKSQQLAPYVDKCLPSQWGQHANGHGTNIEGIAVLDAMLYVGFRGPVVDGMAYLLALNRDALFRKEAPDGETIPIALGKGMGVRDLAAVANGLLILSGPEDDVPGSAAIHRFDPKTRAMTFLGELPDIAPKAKPEALLVLEESKLAYRVLILSDGVKKGAPTEFVVPKSAKNKR